MNVSLSNFRKPVEFRNSNMIDKLCREDCSQILFFGNLDKQVSVIYDRCSSMPGWLVRFRYLEKDKPNEWIVFSFEKTFENARFSFVDCVMRLCK